jgi:hypothetical protein
MSLIEPILKSALLGTEKWMPPMDGLPQQIGTFIKENAADREDSFLKYAGLCLTYQQAGALPAEATKQIEVCPADNLTPLKPKQADLLRECLKTKDELLTGYLAYKSNEAALVAPGDTIPNLLDMAVQHKKLRTDLLAFSGITGQWLTQFNPHWQTLVMAKTDDLSEEETWETGSETERVLWLENLRKTEPARAIELLEKAFPQENANTRLLFLQTLHFNKSVDDEAFLTTLLSDKSKQVKQEAMYLLKTIPGTRINNLYLEYCTAVCSIREERYMLLSKKKVMHIADNLEPSKELFATGINKVSSLKGMPDHLSWFAEVLAFTPPDLLATALGIPADNLLDLLLANKDLEPLQIHFTSSAIHFGNFGWIRKLITHGVPIRSGMLQILPWQEGLQHLPTLLKNDPGEARKMIEENRYKEIPIEIAQRVFNVLKEHPYNIQKPDYRNLALSFPVEGLQFIQPFLETGASTQTNPYFINQALEMEKILMTKKIFNS